MDASSFNIAKETWSYIAKGFLTESFYRHTEMHTCIAGACGTGWGAGCVDFHVDYQQAQQLQET
jgi:hypothetical protein